MRPGCPDPPAPIGPAAAREMQKDRNNATKEKNETDGQPGNDEGKGNDKGQTELVAQKDNTKNKNMNKSFAVLPNAHAPVSDSACQGT